MPIHTIEKIKTREARLGKGLSETAEGSDPLARRGKRKQLKRAQRKRRRLVTAEVRRAGKPAKSDSE